MLPIVQHSLEVATLPSASSPTNASTAASTPAIAASTSSSTSTLTTTITATTASSPITNSDGKAVKSVKKELTTAGVRITENGGGVVQSGTGEDEEVERVASVLAKTGLRERVVPATKE